MTMRAQQKWYIISSTGEVVASGPVPYSYTCAGYCGDIWCGFEPNECYTVSTNGTSGGYSGNIYVQLPDPTSCNTCTMSYAELNNDNTTFCMMEECGGITDYFQSSGYGSEDDVVWTLTNTNR